MICPNCSYNFEDNMMYCPNCGTAVNNNTTTDNSAYSDDTAYSNNGTNLNNGAYANNNTYTNNGAYANNGYQQSAPYSSQSYGNPAYYQQQPQPQPNPTVMQYVGWMLLGSLFGPISLIISIVFACSSTNKPRADYFKAHLIVMAISVVISIIAVIAVALIGFSFTDVLTDATFDMYSEFMQIASLVA